MRVAELRLHDGRPYAPGSQTEPPPSFRRLARLGVMASAAEPFDPMEIAFHEFEKDQGRSAIDVPHSALREIRLYPLEPSLLAVTRVWSVGDEAGDYVVASKGAPEAIADLCQLDEAARAALHREVDAMAGRGQRVLGVAEARWRGAELPDTPHGFAFQFRGLVGLRDPLRESVPAAVRDCRTAGVRVVMITGDYPETARTIAEAAGIDAHAVVTGRMLDEMSDAELAQQVREIGVFARILPEQKLRIVEALKAQGEIVGMTGDGVNDAPSLKAADIGIAMGKRGTDVAREASAVVLLDDDFGSIVAAIRMGRRIYDNLAKAMAFIISVHVPIAGLALMPLTFGLPILLGPIHMALLEMIIDPVCSLAFEAETDEPDIMRRPPRDTRAKLLSIQLVGRSVVQGAIAFAAVSAVLFVFVSSALATDEVRSTVFVALVAAVIALVLVNRSFSASLLSAVKRPNPALATVVLLVALLLGLAELVPAAGKLFGFSSIGLPQTFAALAAGVSVLLLLEAAKYIRQTRSAG
jgi:P-type Ca2+ transporter type 2C